MNHQLQNNPNWRGGRFWHKYKNCMMIRVNGKYVREHRYVVEQNLGKPLGPETDVKWKNGDRRDNRLENLITIRHSDNRLR